MRVTSFVTRDRRTADVLAGEARLEQARDRVSTGHRVERPADAPDQIAELLRVKSEITEFTRRKDGADAALPGMQAGEAALNDMSGALRELRTLALQANNSTLNADDRGTIADQMERVRARLLSLANTQFGGRYLFAGTKTDAAPFSQGPPVDYNGSAAPLEMSLTSSSPFAVSVTGDALLNRRGGTDLFQNLADLETAVRAGDSAAISTRLSALDDDLTNVLRLNGDLGARVQYVQMAQQQADDGLSSAQGRQSDLQDVDLSEAILDENTAQVAHQAALAMAGRIDQPSLLDYLR